MFTHLAIRFKAWRTRRAIAHISRHLRSRGVHLSRYTDDSLAWLEIHGARIYFDGPERRDLVTTYQPEERTRTLITTSLL